MTDNCNVCVHIVQFWSVIKKNIYYFFKGPLSFHERESSVASEIATGFLFFDRKNTKKTHLFCYQERNARDVKKSKLTGQRLTEVQVQVPCNCKQMSVTQWPHPIRDVPVSSSPSVLITMCLGAWIQICWKNLWSLMVSGTAPIRTSVHFLFTSSLSVTAALEPPFVNGV